MQKAVAAFEEARFSGTAARSDWTGSVGGDNNASGYGPVRRAQGKVTTPRAVGEVAHRLDKRFKPKGLISSKPQTKVGLGGWKQDILHFIEVDLAEDGEPSPRKCLTGGGLLGPLDLLHQLREVVGFEAIRVGH